MSTHKDSWKEYLENYRPDLGAWEGYETDHLECHHTTHTEEHIRPRQQGFRKGRSCLTSLQFYHWGSKYL